MITLLLKWLMWSSLITNGLVILMPPLDPFGGDLPSVIFATIAALALMLLRFERRHA